MGLLDLEDPLYEAFSRNDQYGALGKSEQTLSEKIRLVVMGLTLVPLRLFGCLYFVVAFYLTCRLVHVETFSPLVVRSQMPDVTCACIANMSCKNYIRLSKIA